MTNPPVTDQAMQAALGNLVGITELATLLKCSVPAIRWRVTAGTLPPCDAHIGRTPVWFRTHIHHLLDTDGNR